MSGTKRKFLNLMISFSLVNCSVPLKYLLNLALCVCCTDLLAEHLQEIRALRQRLEESICTNDRLREQLEKRLAEVEKDPGTHCPILSLSVLLLGNSAHKIKHFFSHLMIQQLPTSSSMAMRSRASWPMRCDSSGDKTKL